MTWAILYLWRRPILVLATINAVAAGIIFGLTQDGMVGLWQAAASIALGVVFAVDDGDNGEDD